MGDDQAVAGEGAFRQTSVVEREALENFHQVGIAPGGHGQDELQLAATLVGQRRQLPDILQAQEAAIGHQDDALDRKAL